jgi:hypothetical protein
MTGESVVERKEDLYVFARVWLEIAIFESAPRGYMLM